ncbi:nucleoside/nucleotide kinase family protein [Oceanobacillus kimchii]|uniref:Thymidylate kinase-like domain-containing protein n=1 Tax=Oceanobacillus kimchii TaxID=746691 RepID=A0ABQ5TKK1_9BACI|nr:hypothetical protein [Oceanobacillus kimchii]GLO66224.1 hypothetical protein MACH08_20080 [Oceanobacillus kimchii]
MIQINIIIEGIDGSGKTTAINLLQEFLEKPIVKGSDFSHAAQGNTYLYNKFFKLTELDNTIFDRSHISNLVYASIYKNYAILNDEQVSKIETRLKNKSIAFYLSADLDIIEKRIISRGDAYVKADKLEEIRNKYEDVLNDSNLDFIKINTSYSYPLEVVKEIMHHAGFSANS